MNYSDDKLNKYYNLVFNYALYRIGNIETAKDIASQTISIFLLTTKKIQEENVNGWLINTAKNYCNQFFDNLTMEQNKIENYRTNILPIFQKYIQYEKDEQLNRAFTEAFNSLSDSELKTIFLYFKCDQNVIEMHKIMGESYPALRKKIYRLKRKLKAETFKKLGVIATKKIVTPKLNDLITKFLLRFKENLENKSLNKMYYYFSEVDLKKYNPSYEIKKILDYEIRLTESVYKVWVFFKNKQNQGDSFYIEFYIDENNHLKIITPPTRPKKIIKLDSNSIEAQKIKELLKKSPVDRNGKTKYPIEELEKILKQLEEKN